MWIQIAMLVASVIMQQKQQSQQKKHQRKIREAQQAKADEERKRAIRDEKSALKKRQAAMRAKMGASGSGFGGGSSAAVMQGMQNQTTQNILDMNKGAEMNRHINDLSASDGVSQGLKNAQTALQTGEKIYGIANS